MSRVAANIKKARKEYPGFDRDEKQFGVDVAMYNAGFLKGDTNGKERGFKRAFALISGGKWTAEERKWANSALKGKNK